MIATLPLSLFFTLQLHTWRDMLFHTIRRCFGNCKRELQLSLVVGCINRFYITVDFLLLNVLCAGLLSQWEGELYFIFFSFPFTLLLFFLYHVFHFFLPLIIIFSQLSSSTSFSLIRYLIRSQGIDNHNTLVVRNELNNDRQEAFYRSLMVIRLTWYLLIIPQYSFSL